MPDEDAAVKSYTLRAKFEAGQSTRPVFHWGWSQRSPVVFHGVSIRYNEQCLLADLKQFSDSWEVLFYAGERLIYRSVVWSIMTCQPLNPAGMTAQMEPPKRTTGGFLMGPAEFTVYLKGADFIPQQALEIEVGMWFEEAGDDA